MAPVDHEKELQKARKRAKADKNLQAIKVMANAFGWRVIKFDPMQDLISFSHPQHVDWGRVNVWYTKMTVGTALFHPVKGRTQLFRRGVDGLMLRRIFLNPRAHTGRGYYRRH